MAEPNLEHAGAARPAAKKVRRTRDFGRQRSRWRLMGLALLVVLTAAALPGKAVAAPDPGVAAAGAPPQPPSSPCANPTPPPDVNQKAALATYDPASAPLALPNWGDSGGWVNPSMYETIRSGDIDGDGRGELLGRNGTTMETWTAAPPERRADQDPYVGADTNTWPAAPNQWVPKSVTNPAPGGGSPNEPDMPEDATLALAYSEASTPAAVPGFSDPSRYQTVQLANVMPGAGLELLVRSPQFTDLGLAYPIVGTALNIYSYSNGQWSTPAPFLQFPDLTARPSPQLPNFGSQQVTDGIGGTPWFLPEYYTSIQTADLDGDGLDEIVARASDGLHEFYWDGDGFSETTDTTNGGGDRLLKDSDGFTRVDMYETLQFADFNHDNRDEVAVRSGDNTEFGDGMLTAQWVGSKSNGGWSWGPRWDDWSDANGWTQPSQYETITTGDLNGDQRADLLANGPSGLTAITFTDDNTAFKPLNAVAQPLPSAPSAPTDWTQAPYYSTIQMGDVYGSAADEVLARGADGLHTFTFTAGGTGGFQEILSPLTQFSDANGWLDISKYTTIQTAMVTTGQKRVVIGRDKTGVRTFATSAAGAGGWFAPSISFPAWAGGEDPNANGDGTDAGRTYDFINQQIAFKMNWITPTFPGEQVPATWPTIRSKFVTGSGVSDWQDVASNIELLVPSDALNVDRNTYEAVQRSMADWARDVAVIWGLFFANSSGQSLEQALLTALVVGDVGNPVSTIQQSFNPQSKDRLWVWLSDLLWGAIGGIPIEAAEDAAKDTKKLVNGIKFAQSLVAAASSAAVTNYAPDSTNKKQGQVNMEAQYINQMLVANFCSAISFLYGSADQAATDLGLLTALGQSIRAEPIEPTYAYPDMVGRLSNQRTVWVYQQFASMDVNGVGWQVDWANQQDQSKLAGPLIPGGSQTYAAHGLGGKCSDSHAEDAMKSLIANQGLDPFDLAQPTWSFWATSESHTVGDPNTSQVDGDTDQKMGTGGWRLPKGSHCS